MRTLFDYCAPSVVQLALALTAQDKADELLSTLCLASLNAWAVKVSDTAPGREVRSAITAAAAYTAAAGWMKSGGGASGSVSDVSVKLGEVSVSPVVSESRLQRAEGFLREAERLMTPYTADPGFAFRGVEG